MVISLSAETKIVSCFEIHKKLCFKHLLLIIFLVFLQLHVYDQQFHVITVVSDVLLLLQGQLH
jgi:hypothetical protein